MTRDLTAAAQNAAEAAVVRPVILVYLDLAPDVRINSSDRDITYDGHVYQGIGTLGAISAIEERSGLQANGIKLAMTGIRASDVEMVLNQNYQGKGVEVYQGFLDENYALIADPILQWTGMIDQMALTLGETASVSLTAESRLIRWETPNVRRYTDADQQAAFPGDLGCQFVSQTVEREILWGRTRARQ